MKFSQKENFKILSNAPLISHSLKEVSGNNLRMKLKSALTPIFEQKRQFRKNRKLKFTETSKNEFLGMEII